MAVLDSTFLIALLKGDPQAFHRLGEVESFAPPLRVPAAVWIELFVGLPPERRERLRNALLQMAEFEPLDRRIAEEAVRVQYELVRQGRRLSWHDLQIAATALLHKEPLISNDRTFDGIPGLEWHPHGAPFYAGPGLGTPPR